MKKFLTLALAGVMALTMAACSSEDSYPSKNITCVIPYGAGGTMDTLSRLTFECLDDDALPSGVNFVVENIAGAGGLTGVEQGLTRDADGYTIVGVNQDLVISRAIGATDIVLEDEFIPLCVLQAEPYCLIGGGEGACSTLDGFISTAQAGKVNVAITGLATPGGIAANYLNTTLGCNIQMVTYDDTAACALAVVSGECDATFAPVAVVSGQVEAGTMTVLAVTTADECATLPGIPAIAQVYAEAADMDLSSTCMLAAIAGTPDEIVTELREMLKEAIGSSAYAESTSSMYMTPAVWSDAQMEAFYVDAYDFYIANID